MSQKKRRIVIIVVPADPHPQSPAQLAALTNHYRSICDEPWKADMDRRNGILLDLFAANVPLTCEYCGKGDLLPYTKARSRMMTLDHIIPKCLGGTNERDNFAISCNSCNSQKGGDVLSPKRRRKIKTVKERLEIAQNKVYTSTLFA